MNLSSTTPSSLLHLGASVLPVLGFLATLTFLDTYKLIRFRSIILSVLAGGGAALISLVMNGWMLELTGLEMATYSRYGGPIIEELCKAAYLVYLIRSSRVGFMVDAAIHGFAVGAGFACIENIYYWQSLPAANPLLWLLRGSGTAIMHGGATAICGMISRNLADRHASTGLRVYLPGLATAIAVHSLFNHFFLSPLLSTAMLLLLLPLIVVAVFQYSEKVTRRWLDLGFDTDRELLEVIRGGRISTTRIGAYLQSLKNTFPGEIVVDMLCLLRLHLELSIHAKGVLLLRETGFEPEADPEIKRKFDELNYLEKSIGKTGMLAIAPFVHTKSRDLWQLHMLGRR